MFYAARRGFPTVVRLLLERGADNQIKSKFKDLARDDCLNKRTEVAFDDVKTIKPTSGGPAKCLVGRLLLNVLSFLDSTSLCRAAQVNGRWHGKASQKDLWNSLGLSRWEMAMDKLYRKLRLGLLWHRLYPVIAHHHRALLNQTSRQ